MSWLRDALGPKEPEATKCRRELFNGTFGEVGEKFSDLPETLQKLMFHALNAPGNPDARGVREVGDRMVFEMKGVMVDVANSEGKLLGHEQNIGDYEIEVRRVR